MQGGGQPQCIGINKTDQLCSGMLKWCHLLENVFSNSVLFPLQREKEVMKEPTSVQETRYIQ